MSIRRAAMKATNMKNTISKTRLLLAPMVAVAFTAAVYAAAPGITGPSFNLTAQQAYITQPDGQAVYSWGYGCNSAPSGFNPPATKMPGANCPTMQVPGPTLVVNEGDSVTVTLTNALPTAAGNTSILFPGFVLQPFTDGTPGLLTQEAAPGATVTYKFTASSPGTRAYYSGTQGDLQVEMGLYGATIVLPSQTATFSNCNTTVTNLYGKQTAGPAPESDFRLAVAAYDHPQTCYDRE